jgi:hypothetical protein
LNGEVVTEQMLWGMSSYRRTMAELDAAIAQYNKDASGIIRASQSDAGWLGVSGANSIISASFYANGLAPANWERINHEGVEQMIATMNRETPWYGKLYDVYGADVTAMRDAMITDLGRGLSEVVMAEHMRDALDIGLNKSLLIAETEMGRAYRNGTIQQYQESGVVTGYLRLVKKETACLGCLMLDGERYDVADQMEDHPRGFCDVIAEIPGVANPEWEKGADWFERQDEERQREIMGDTRYELMQRGTRPQNMVYKRDDPFYGKQPAIKPLSDTRGYDSWKREQKEAKEAEKAAQKAAQATAVKQEVKYNGGNLPSYNVDAQTLSSRHDLWKDDLMKREGMSPNQADAYIKRAEERLEKIATMGTPTVRVDEYAFSRITTEGRFKTQFETQHSNGYLAPDYRASAERKGLGAPLNLDPTKRPIYGYLEPPNQEWGSDWGVNQYGDIRMVLSRDAVANRTYFTLGDSLGGFEGEHFYGTPLSKPGIEALEARAQFMAKTDKDFFQSFYGYAEIQVKDGLSITDVEKVILPSGKRSYFENQGATYLQELKKHGIKIIWD